MKIKTDYKYNYDKEINDFINCSGMSYEYKKYIVDKTEELAELLEDKIINGETIYTTTVRDVLDTLDDGMSGFQYDMILYILYRYWYYEPLIIRTR